jgi:hypothetical protein
VGRKRRWDEGGGGVRCGDYRVIGSYCVLRCSSVVVGEGAFVRHCRRIGQMGIMCRIGIVDYSFEWLLWRK